MLTVTRLAVSSSRLTSWRALPLLTAALCGLAAPSAAFAEDAPATPAALLKWSMNKYADMPTFQAECKWILVYPGAPGMEAKRTLQYAKPNQFKIVSVTSSQFASVQMTQTSVSDGKKMVEYSSIAAMGAQSYPAPPSLADANTMTLQHPMFGGTLLYKFFGGSDKYAALVNEAKMPLAFGTAATLDGQPCKTVTFWAQGNYGKTEIAIGEQDGLVHRIRYDSKPLMEQTKKMMQSPEFLAQIKKTAKDADTKELAKMMPTTSDTTEIYEKIVVGQAIEPSVFTAKAPEGVQEQEMGGGADPKPPVALGQPAPDITVTSMDGTKKKLTDFRGKVVLIDFWATWCPPCRKGLPETQKFYTDYGQKGLAVLTISDEDKPTVKAFIAKNKYIFPAYLDKGGAANKAYNIAAIPTTVIIDKNGKLVAYMVGLSPKEDILAALKKAGLQTK